MKFRSAGFCLTANQGIGSIGSIDCTSINEQTQDVTASPHPSLGSFQMSRLSAESCSSFDVLKLTR
jgi:hypothetical protein